MSQMYLDMKLSLINHGLNLSHIDFYMVDIEFVQKLFKHVFKMSD
jgi:hypothetical protein